MIVYKLFKLRKDGTLGPLFINASMRVPIGLWLPAEDHPTKGFAHRPGWHATLKPFAPHLKDGPDSGRVWCLCEAEGVTLYDRPESQGGTWVLAQRIRVLEVLGPVVYNEID